MSLTPAQRWAIQADLAQLRGWGFTHIRLLTTTKAGDPAYDPWPADMFLTFPQPTSAELTNWFEFGQITKSMGFTTEVVLLMPSSTDLYYQNGVTAANYATFIDALFNYSWGGNLSRIYLGGDLRLGDHDEDQALVASHRQFVKDAWPHLIGRCPTCAMGLHLASANQQLWDRAADSIAWARANLTRVPSFFGCQLYPSSHEWLKAAGWEKNGVVDWTGLTDDWVSHLRAAAGPVPIHADEIGLEIGPFTEDEQASFLAGALVRLPQFQIGANVWELAEHTGYGDFGLVSTDRQPRLALVSIARALRVARAAGVSIGLQYAPPEFGDLAWLMPQ